ncbi:sugar ABC transporter permease [Paenibacillus sp. FSL H8-0548]|uniref:carbohydrate ABC transporter permease n=1 Tax=Paenibacillus sp. FSL H8-0548 TaxID=1920422 RepID=UPI00096E4D99|nr:carbohydrate ABC transporter permease [Paenibacillus sp. FSL H8-0548]OMF38854.1 sugar ABC transporter permease [Paenibacillus sp. FSL H8-0548]
MPQKRLNPYIVHSIFILAAVSCLFPVVLLIMASLTSSDSLIVDGYSLFPKNIDFEAYQYLWNQGTTIFSAFGISTLITVVGTIAGVIISALIAYPLSRQDMPFRKIIAFLVFFSMLFNGGLVSAYLVYTEIFHIKNTLLALLLPNLLTNGFLIFLIRTFFTTSVPIPVIESAYIDGAGEGLIFRKIVLPLSLPIMATSAITVAIVYWNDWNNGLIYLTDPQLFGIQNLLNRMLSDAQFFQSNSLGGQNVALTSNVPLESVRLAMGVVGMLPLIIAYPFFQKYLIGGLTIGAVKG